MEGAGKRRRRRPPEPPGERRSWRNKLTEVSGFSSFSFFVLLQKICFFRIPGNFFRIRKREKEREFDGCLWAVREARAASGAEFDKHGMVKRRRVSTPAPTPPPVLIDIEEIDLTSEASEASDASDGGGGCSGWWSCSSCTFANSGTVCEMCGAGRPLPPRPPPPPPPDAPEAARETLAEVSE